MQLRTARLACLLSFAAAVAACGGDSPSGSSGGSGPKLQIVAGDQVTDTIDARPAQGLVVQVTGRDGKPARGVVVEFASTLVGPDAYRTPSVWLSPQGSNEASNITSATTDSEGRAAVKVQLGSRAGPGAVAIAVQTLGLLEGAHYTVLPGAPWAVNATPGDTTLYVGRNALLRATVMDRAENPRTDPVTFTVASGPVTLSGATATITGIGRGVVVARVGAVADTSYVSGVPEGTVAGFTGDMELYTANLDGTGMRLLATASAGRGYFGEMPAAWSADGQSLVYHDSRSDHNRLLYSVNAAGGPRVLLIAAPDGISSQAWPQRSRDGQWIYFNGIGTWQGTYVGNQIFRVHADGTGMERLDTGGGFVFAGYPSPSPDGTRVAFISGRDISSGGLHVLNLATGANTGLGIGAATPRWSPAGDLIAYVSIPPGIGYLDNHSIAGYGELRVVRPDGTGDRRVTATAGLYLPGIDWSPDGKYLIATSQQSGDLVIVDVATGAEAHLRLPRPVRAPVWRP
jgi:Tol biopolymer transport system component